MDTRTNYPTLDNVSSYLGRTLNTGDLAGLNNQIGNTPETQSTFQSGGNIYQVKDNGNNTFSIQQIDTIANRQGVAAQQQYQAGVGTAIQGLQTQKTNLSQQYSDLLKTVKGQYDPLINQTTATAGKELAQRGITPDSTLYQQETQGALQPVYGAEAANAQQIGAGSISDTNTLAQAIAGLQAGAAGTSATLPLNYGSLAMSMSALPSQIALAQAQAKQAQTSANYVPTSYGGLILNTQSNQVINPMLSALQQLGYKLNL